MCALRFKQNPGSGERKVKPSPKEADIPWGRGKGVREGDRAGGGGRENMLSSRCLFSSLFQFLWGFAKLMFCFSIFYELPFKVLLVFVQGTLFNLVRKERKIKRTITLLYLKTAWKGKKNKETPTLLYLQTVLFTVSRSSLRFTTVVFKEEAWHSSLKRGVGVEENFASL